MIIEIIICAAYVMILIMNLILSSIKIDNLINFFFQKKYPKHSCPIKKFIVTTGNSLPYLPFLMNSKIIPFTL